MREGLFKTWIAVFFVLGMAGPVGAQTVSGKFFQLPIAALLTAEEEGWRAVSRTLFHLEDGTKITFIRSDHISAIQKKYGAEMRAVPEQAPFRMVVDEIYGQPTTPAYNAEISFSLNFFVREQNLGEDLDRQGLENSPLSGTLQGLNPILWNAISSRSQNSLQRVLFHWEVRVDGSYQKIFLPAGGTQVSREVTLSPSKS